MWAHIFRLTFSFSESLLSKAFQIAKAFSFISPFSLCPDSRYQLSQTPLALCCGSVALCVSAAVFFSSAHPARASSRLLSQHAVSFLHNDSGIFSCFFLFLALLRACDAAGVETPALSLIPVGSLEASLPAFSAWDLSSCPSFCYWKPLLQVQKVAFTQSISKLFFPLSYFPCLWSSVLGSGPLSWGRDLLSPPVVIAHSCVIVVVKKSTLANCRILSALIVFYYFFLFIFFK